MSARANNDGKNPRARPLGGPVIALQRVAKVYGHGSIAVHALRGISFRVDHGDYVAIMGSSGSGKSTLMNIIGCLDLPTSGRYLLDGVDVRKLEDNRLATIRNRKIGFIFQSFNLIPRTSAFQNVELPLAYAGLKPRERKERTLEALDLVGLLPRAHHLPSELSGGQQQRVAVARAIATNPSLVLADEPTGNLDSYSTNEVLGIFDRLNVAGRTIVLITHEDHVAEHAKRVIWFKDGEIIEDRRQAPVDKPPPRLAARALEAAS